MTKMRIFLALLVLLGWGALPLLPRQLRAEAANETPIHVLQKQLATLAIKGETGFDASVDAAKIHFQLSQLIEDEKLQLAHLEHGRDAAERALKEKPDAPDAILLWTANAGTYAGMKKNLAALATVKTIETRLKHLKRIAPKHQFAAADRGLGTIYLKAPSIISIGSAKNAKKHLEAAYRQFPDYPGNQIAWAEYLSEEEKSRTTQAVELARKVLRAAMTEAFAVERRDWSKRANAILQRHEKSK